jgi:hypothetical protein
MCKHHPIDGPDFLDQYADRLAANNLELEADQVRRVQKQWLAERVEHQRLADEASSTNLQLRNVRFALGLPATH